MNSRQVAVMLYKLKHSNATRVDIYQPINAVLNVRTGQRTGEYQRYIVKKAIVLERSRQRDFIMNLAMVFNIPNSGTFENYDRIVIIDAKDIKGYMPRTDAICQIGSSRYEIVSVTETPDNYGYTLRIRRVDNIPAIALARSVSDTLALTESNTNGL